MINFGKAYEIRFYRSDDRSKDQEPYLTILSDQKNMLRVTFEAKKSYLSSLSRNTMTLIIYNLKQGTRDLIRDANDYVEFKAGWRGRPLKTVFRGIALAVNHKVSPPDAVTEIICLDETTGINSFNSVGESIDTWSFSENTTVSSAVEKIIKEKNLDVGYNGINLNSVLKNGYASSGAKLVDVLKDLVSRAESFLTINDGQIEIYRKNLDNLSDVETSLGRSSAIIVDEQNGMIGYPQRFGNNFKNPFLIRVLAADYKNSWRSVIQLDGSVRLFKYVSITCPALNVSKQTGIIIGILHRGDTHGGVWQTTIDSLGV